MQVQKNFNDRIQDLAIQYGSKAELARSLGVSRQTIYNWLDREEPPKGLESQLERKTGNAKAIERREYYFDIEKPREKFREKKEVEPFEETPEGIIKRPLELFEFREFGFEIGDSLNNFDLDPAKDYQITIDIMSSEMMQATEIKRILRGEDFKYIESIAWAWARQAKNITGTSEISLTVTAINPA